MTAGDRVYVYRNRTAGGYSVVRRGRVVAHAQFLELAGVTFKVRADGRRRLLETGRRTPHAFAVGTPVDPPSPVPADAVRVVYDPYRFAAFVTAAAYAPVAAAARCWLTPAGVFVTEPT